jgi:hypothetical protein
MIRTALAGLGLAALAAFAAPVHAAPPPSNITVEITPASKAVVLGDSLHLTVTVTNTSDQPTADLVIHLDITDPSSSSSVDPEDWTSILSKPVGVILPGDTGTVDWNIQPISPGTFSAYAVAISPDTADLVASNVLTVDVADQRSLNPGGILPVAIAMPALVGALLLTRALAARRAARPVAA